MLEIDPTHVGDGHGPRLAAMPDHQPGGRHVPERAFQAATGGIRDIDPLAGLQAAGVQQLIQGLRRCAGPWRGPG